MPWIFMLCRARPDDLHRGMRCAGRWLACCVAALLVGAGCYGATIGLWRSPLQGLYTGIKFPLLILLTATGTALINGMLAQLIGLAITFRQTFLSVVTCFSIASVVLGSLSPITLFLLLNTSPLGSPDPMSSHHMLLLVHVALIALAGIVGHASLFRLLRHVAGSSRLAARILSIWLATNLFLGCQLSWSLRPFVGTPGIPVEFLREDAFQGNFYESIYKVCVNLIG